MAEVVIPDFVNPKEFISFVATLKDEDIRSWKTADWNRLFENLDKVVDSDSRFNFANNEGKDAFMKLYRNYRLERQDFNRMRAQSRKIEKNMLVLLRQDKNKVPLINTDNAQIKKVRKEIAEIFDKAVYKASKYPMVVSDSGTGKKLATKINDYEKTRSSIVVKDTEGCEGSTVVKNKYSSKIELTTSADQDIIITTSIHESVHAHLQTFTQAQKEVLRDMAVSPSEGMSVDFYRLLQHNDEYYLAGETVLNDENLQEVKEQYNERRISREKYNKYKHKIYKSQRKQPMETHADIIAMLTERYYRQETGQYSERTERAFVELIDYQPTEISFNGGEYAAIVYQDGFGALKDYTAMSKFISPEEKQKIAYSYDENKGKAFFVMPKNYAMTSALCRAQLNQLISEYFEDVITESLQSAGFESDGRGYENCALNYGSEGTEKIKDFLRKHADTLKYVEQDRSGAVLLPQSEYKLKYIRGKLYEIITGKNKINDEKYSAQKTNEERLNMVREKINPQSKEAMAIHKLYQGFPVKDCKPKGRRL